MTDVYIKNIPLSYLKGQSKGFFKTDLFKNATTVFDKYKKPVDANESGKSLDQEILPLDMLNTVLINKYQDIDVIPNTQSDREDLLFIGMSGKANKKTLFSPKRYITKCVSEFKAIDNCFFTMYNANTLYNSHRAHSNKPSMNLDNSILKRIAKPDNTSNVISDITDKAKFYESIDNPKVYDDVLYKEELLARLYNLNLIVTKLTLPAAVLKRRVNSTYPVLLKNEYIACEELVTELVEKYKSEYAHAYISKDTLSTVEKVTSYTKVIESVLASKRRNLPVSVFIGSGFSNVANTITHNMDNKECKAMIINVLTGKEITKDCKLTVINNNSIKVEYIGTSTGVFNMTVCLLFSNRPTLNIKTTALASFQDLSDRTILYKFTKTIVNHKCAIDIQLFNTLYGFYEIRSGGVIVNPIMVQTSANNIEFTFDTLLEGWIDVIIMPNNSILKGVSKTKINESQVLDVMKGTNLYDNRISIWREL